MGEVAAASAVAGTVGAGLFAWTGIGAAAAAAAGATATALQITIELKKKEYEEAKDAANLTEQEVKEMRTNENAAIQIVAQLTAATKALLMMLVGAAPAEARMLEAWILACSRRFQAGDWRLRIGQDASP